MAARRADSYRKKIRSKTPEFLRSKNENRLGMTISAIAITFMIVVVGVNSVSMFQKEAKYAAREQELRTMIEQESKRTEQLNEFKTYTKTKKYAEEVAKDKLGLVYENEILFQEVE